jgi:hypothetical protein
MSTTDDQIRALVRRWVDAEIAGDTVRDHGSAAVTIGVHVQQARYRGTPMDGTFRLTFVTLRDGTEWPLAGAQLSPMLGAAPATPGT